MQEIEPGYSVDSWMQSLYHLGLIANIFAILLMVCGLVWFIYLRKEGNFREIKWKGRRLLFVSIVVVPFFVLLIGHFYAADVSKRVSFCGSCHVMQSYVKDMINPTSISLAAIHYDRAVINENQCRACHEKYYGIKGDAFAKLTGSRHALKYIWWEARKLFTGNNYEFNIEVPSKLSLNSNCLNCHGRSIKSFFHIIDHQINYDFMEEAKNISITKDRQEIKAAHQAAIKKLDDNEHIHCYAEGCHETVHIKPEGFDHAYSKKTNSR